MRWQWGAKQAGAAERRQPLFDVRGRPMIDLSAVDPCYATEDGIVAVGGGEVSVTNLRAAYRVGIFPWPHDGYPLLWFSPDPRAILEFADLHVPKSLAKEQRKGRFTFTIDTSFEAVMARCGQTPRPGQAGTWITPAMRRSYAELHRLGMAHSVEAWGEDGTLAGGLYGVDCGGIFTGESMFYREPYASKLALLFLIDRLRDWGCEWLDIQTMTPHFQQLGAVDIPREVFLERLRTTQGRGLQLFKSFSESN